MRRRAMSEQTNPEILPDENEPGPDGQPAHELVSDPDITHVKRVLEAALLS